MKTISLTKARNYQISRLSQYLQKNKVIGITRHHQIAFLVVDIDYFEAVMESLDILSDPEAVEMLKECIIDIKHKYREINR